MPPALSRRTLLRAVAFGTGAVLLSGCEDLDPRTPVSPTEGVRADDPATWPPDTQLMIAARQRIHGYRLGLDVVKGPRGTLRELGAHWRQQQERLEMMITLGGVPLPELLDHPAVTVPPGDAASTGDGSARTAGPDDASSTTSPPRPLVDASELGRVLRVDHTDACRELSTATPANLPFLASLTAQHVDSAARLDAPVEWEALEGPGGTPAVPVLAVLRPAIFGLEVVAARSGGEERARYESVLGPLRSVTRQLATLAGTAAPVPPLGYDLPEPLEDQQDREALARALVADIAPATLETAQRLSGDMAGVVGVVRIVSDTVAWDRILGTETRPFPGMTVP